VIGICTTRVNIWETLVPFKRRVWRLTKFKTHLCHVIGSTARSTFFRDDTCWWWVSDLSPIGLSFFFPLFFSFSSLKNNRLVHFFIGISTSVLILSIFNFSSLPFSKSFIYFQFYSSIPNWHILFFSIWSLFFWFLIFFLGFFRKSFIYF
jgi:hypothetical protein